MSERSNNTNRNTRRYVVSLVGFLAAVVLLAGMMLTGRPASADSPSAKGEPVGVQPEDLTYPIREGFEHGDTGAFHSAVATCVPGGCGWHAVTNFKHSGDYAAFAPDVANISDQRLVLNAQVYIPANTTAASLTFWHRYDFEAASTNYYDAGLLEVSTDNGTTWSDSGVQFVSGGYNGTVHAGGNPLAGRNAWVGSTGGAYLQVQADLISYANHSVLIRFREGTDTSNAAGGWWVDDIQLKLDRPTACATPTWNMAQPYPLTMAFPASVSLNGKLYLFGGVDSSSTTLGTAYRYDPGDNSWTLIAPIPAPRYGAAATTDGTYIYILGGNNPTSDPMTDLWRYDPTANTYTPLASYSHPTYLHEAVFLNGKVYRIGGSTNNFSTETVEVYTVSSNTWAPTTDLPSANQSLNATTHGDYIYIAGGMRNGAGGAVFDKTYRYDPSTPGWDDAAIADLPQTRYSSVDDWLNGRWVLATGSASSSLSTSVVAWDPGGNAWSSLPNTLEPFFFSGGGSIGQNFFVVGGQNNSSTRTSDHQRYTEIPCDPSTPTPTATSTVGPRPTACAIEFSDVPADNTFYANVRCLSCRNIINGYPDGTFKPNNNITRGQLSKIVSNSAGFQDPQPTQMFEDIPVGSTFHLFVGRLASRNFISGYACGGVGEPCGNGNLPYFRPNNNATRGQISKIVSNTAGFSEPQPNQLFEDVPAGNTFYDFIGRLASRGYMNGYPCGGVGEPCGNGNLSYFRPNNNATRGQTSKIVGNTFFPNCQTPADIAGK
jgi:hypothetical protein